MAFASDESVAMRRTTSPRAATGKYKLSGRKLHVLDGHVADRLIVSARTSGDTSSRDGITLFLIDAKASGVTITRTPMVDSRNSAVVELRDVAVTEADVIGTFDKGAIVLDAVLDAGRAVLAAELLGRRGRIVRSHAVIFARARTVQRQDRYVPSAATSCRSFV